MDTVLLMAKLASKGFYVCLSVDRNGWHVQVDGVIEGMSKDSAYEALLNAVVSLACKGKK